MRGIGRLEVLVSINMAISLDGKIATKKRGPISLGSELDLRRMGELRAAHDAVINGAGTFRAYPFPLLVKSQELQLEREKRGQSRHPVSAIVSSALEIPRGTPWETSRETERWVFCGSASPLSSIRSLERNEVRVVKSKRKRPNPKEILKAFSSAGIASVLVEGGGELNAAFLEEGLVQRVYLTLTPLVIGGVESPTWLEGRGFALGKFPRFHLSDLRKEGDELFLTYDLSS